MASISPSVIILGLVVTLVAADQPSTNNSVWALSNQSSANNMSNTTLKGNSTISTVTPPSVTSNITIEIPINITTNNITVNPTVTKKDGGNTTDDKGETTALPTPKPGGATKIPTTKDKAKDMVTPKPAASESDSTGIIIIVVIIIIALVFAVACFFARKRGRRYSVDLTSRPDEANIPLSTVEPELHIDAVPQNGLQTFESVETTEKESQEPETIPEVQEEQKGDADKAVAEPKIESAAPAPSSVDKSKEDAIDPSPPAPVELSLDEKTDDEGAVSNKTSVESLKETNENNSNNADLTQMTDLMLINNFQDVPLDCLV